MVDDTVNLDKRRRPAAQVETDVRRLRVEVEKDQAALKARHDELDIFLSAAPADDWPEAVNKARYLLGLLAETSEDPRRRQLIEMVLADFERLLSARR